MGVASFSMTIPASTPESAPTTQNVMFGPGYLESCTLQFPAGCQYQVHIAIYLTRFQHEKQRVLPQDYGSNTLDNIALDNFVKDFPIGMQLDTTARLTIEGWNDDATNSHTIMVLPNLVPSKPPAVADTTKQSVPAVEEFLNSAAFEGGQSLETF